MEIVRICEYLGIHIILLFELMKGIEFDSFAYGELSHEATFLLTPVIWL
jgi:hypothetical protein